jgi:hypothetical protein
MVAVVRERLYPFGDSVAGEPDTLALFENEDDGSTEPIWIDDGIKLGCELYYSLYVSPLP